MITTEPVDYAQLREEVAALRAEMQTLRQFIAFEHDQHAKVRGVTLHCAEIFCENIHLVDDQARPCAHLASGKDGAALTLLDAAGNARVVLAAADAGPHIELRGGDDKLAARIFADEQGHGNVVVFSPGEVPRVLMKGNPAGGSLAALAPDGKPRAVLFGSDNGGELAVISREGLIGAKLSSIDKGGMLRINHHDGNPAAAVVAAPETGASLMLTTPSGRAGLSAVASDCGTLLQVHGVDQENEPANSGVAIMGFENGGSVTLKNSDGQDLVDLLTAGDGGRVVARGATSDNKCELEANAVDARCRVNHAAGGSVLIVASEQSGMVGVNDPAKKQQAIVSSSAAGGAVVLSDESNLLVSLGLDDTRRPLVTLHNPDTTPAVQLLAHENGGAVTVFNEDGTRQAAVIGSAEGGKLGVFGDLGIERALLQSHKDGGMLSLRWGGTDGVKAGATAGGGAVVVYDQSGEIRGSVPELGDQNLTGEDLDED